MKHLLKISEASIIAVHAMLRLNEKKCEALGASKLSKDLKVSYNHLSKVLQKLAAAKLLASQRGPRGGYYLTQKGRDCFFKDLISAIEGETSYSNCLRATFGCSRNSCELRSFLTSLNSAFKDLMKKKVSQL